MADMSRELAVDLAAVPFPVSYAEVKRGATVADVNRLIDTGILSREDVFQVIPTRTFERRRAKGEHLRLEEVDGIVRLIRVKRQALRVFEDAALADEWLHSKNPALGQERPLHMALSDIGAREVEAVLSRIEHGIFA